MHRELLKIQLASQLLSGLCRNSLGKTPLQREPELIYALETEEILIRLGEKKNGPAFEHSPPTLARAKPVQERDIEREPFDDLLDQRREREGRPRPNGPRLH